METMGLSQWDNLSALSVATFVDERTWAVEAGGSLQCV